MEYNLYLNIYIIRHLKSSLHFFRTSKIGSFTNNVGFVLFECEGAKKVLTLHQEHPVKLELCDELLCDWEQFLDIYKVKKVSPLLSHVS